MKTIDRPSARSFRITANSCSVSWASRLDVGSSRMRTLADAISRARRDRRHLLDRHRVRAERLGHVDVDVEAAKDLLGPADPSPPVIDAAPRPALAPDEDVLRDREVGAEVDFLVDSADPQCLSMLRGADLEVLAVEGDRRPDRGRSTPVRTLIRVDLPAPFSPTRAWISPGRSSKSTPSRAWTPGNALSMRCMDRSGVISDTAHQ